MAEGPSGILETLTKTASSFVCAKIETCVSSSTVFLFTKLCLYGFVTEFLNARETLFLGPTAIAQYISVYFC